MKEYKNISTIACHYAEDREHNYGAVVPPIYQNSLFTFDSWESIDEAFSNPTKNFIYTRGNNPTVSNVEKKIAKMAGGEKARLFSSGMAAISSAIMYCVKKEGHVIAVSNVYGPVNNFLSTYLKEKMGIEVTFVLGKDIEDFEKNIKSNTCLIYLESPSSAIFTLQDIKKVAAIAKKNNIKTIIDNTWATPIFQKPLEMGIDIEVHSCTKYIGGHSDIVAGVIISSEKIIDNIFNKEYLWYGGKIAPFEAWLIMRSLRTLDIRMEKHQKNAMKVAKFLEKHPKIDKVYYPGLESFDQHELAKRQMKGFSGLLAIEVKCDEVDKLKNFVNKLTLFKIGVSWGGHESLIFVPAISYLKEMKPEQFKKLGITLGSIRLSIGLEDADELIEDLENALCEL